MHEVGASLLSLAGRGYRSNICLRKRPNTTPRGPCCTARALSLQRPPGIECGSSVRPASSIRWMRQQERAQDGGIAHKDESYWARTGWCRITIGWNTQCSKGVITKKKSYIHIVRRNAHSIRLLNRSGWRPFSPKIRTNPLELVLQGAGYRPCEVQSNDGAHSRIPVRQCMHAHSCR